MRIEIGHKCLRIYPEKLCHPDNSEAELDIAFLEEVLDLKLDGDCIQLVRKNITEFDYRFCLVAGRPGHDEPHTTTL